MEGLIEMIPLLFSTIICVFYLLLVSGTKYNLKKTASIIIPFTLFIIAFNIVLFEPRGYNVMKNWYLISVFVPEAVLVYFVAKRKGISLITGLLNAYLIFYFILLLSMIADIYSHRYIFTIIVYILGIPLAAIFLHFFYNKLHNIVEKYIPNAFWLMIVYALAILAEINIYRILIDMTVKYTLRLEIFAVAVMSVYIISIAGFYIFLNAYEKKMISDFDNDTLKKQVKNVIEISKIKRNNEEKLKVLRHDLKHVLVSLSSLISNNESDKALELINSYNVLIDETKSKTYCKDPMINSILEYYHNKCMQNNIEFNTKINNFEDILDVPVDELIVVISNCLDNAINASLKIDQKRYINFAFLNNNGRLILQIKNRFDGNIKLDKSKLPTNHEENHGFGTKSIKMFAKKHRVSLDYSIKKNTFEITLLFYKHKKEKSNE